MFGFDHFAGWFGAPILNWVCVSKDLLSSNMSECKGFPVIMYFEGGMYAPKLMSKWLTRERKLLKSGKIYTWAMVTFVRLQTFRCELR
jgi:hypothetical protein